MSEMKQFDPEKVERYRVDFTAHDGTQYVQAEMVLASEFDALYRQREWIPIAERMPEPKTKILVFTEEGHIQIGVWVPSCTCSTKWHLCDSFPVFWQPLPDPPERKGT